MAKDKTKLEKIFFAMASPQEKLAYELKKTKSIRSVDQARAGGSAIVVT